MSASPHYRFFEGTEGAPVLIPIAGINEEAASLTRFCRRICRGASILVPELIRPSAAIPLSGMELRSRLWELNRILNAAIKTHELSLLPIVAIGNGAGADLALAFTLRYGLLLAGSILLRPNMPAGITAVNSLDGVCVLLCLPAKQDAASGTGRQLQRLLKIAGAQSIIEHVPNRTTAGGKETALARVFLASLFGSS